METIQKAYIVKNRTGILATEGVLFANNSERKGLLVQNLSTNKMYLKFGAGCSSTDYDLILKAGNDLDDGNGGTLSYDVLSYTGVITVAGTLLRCTAVEF